MLADLRLQLESNNPVNCQRWPAEESNAIVFASEEQAFEHEHGDSYSNDRLVDASKKTVATGRSEFERA